jgi:hypothetical protein
MACRGPLPDLFKEKHSMKAAKSLYEVGGVFNDHAWFCVGDKDELYSGTSSTFWNAQQLLITFNRIFTSEKSSRILPGM